MEASTHREPRLLSRPRALRADDVHRRGRDRALVHVKRHLLRQHPGHLRPQGGGHMGGGNVRSQTAKGKTARVLF